MRLWTERLALLALCAAPPLLALPQLDEPYGNSEESLNATIWGLGARNLLERGIEGSVRGTRVSPFPGTQGDGIYAHHPPLPVWLMVVPVALGGWEGFSRLLGLGCASASLWLLYRVLRLFFEPRVALAALLCAASSVYLLRYGRLATTLTVAAPLFLAVVLGVLRGDRSRWVLPVVALLALSSWEGVAAGAVLVTVFGMRERWWAPALVYALAVALVAWHLIDATHGVSELMWQFRWRAAGDEVTWAQWGAKQLEWVGEGLGPLTLLALLAGPFVAGSREEKVALALLAVPGVVMELVFRQGALKHAFWGFNLVLPGAFAVALALSRARVAFNGALVALSLQAALSVHLARRRLDEEHTQNALGPLVQRAFKGGEVPVLARSGFHPYLSWYAGSRPQTARSLDELRALGTDDRLALVDTDFARGLGCATQGGPRWQVLPLRAVRERCGLAN